MLEQRTASLLLLTFRFPSTLYRPTPLAGGMAMAFVHNLILSLTARSSVLSFYFGGPCRLRNFAVQRCGSEF